MAQSRKARPPQWFTWTLLVGCSKQTITWTDGVLTGDAWLVAEFLEGAKHIPSTIDPWPYSTGGDWKGDWIVAQWVLNTIGMVMHTETNISPPQWVDGRIY